MNNFEALVKGSVFGLRFLVFNEGNYDESK